MTDTADPDGSPADLAARLERAAAERPDHPALLWDGGELTYAELDRRARTVAATFQERLAVEPGDRVATVLGTTPAFVEVAAAVLRAGATLVPLLPGLAPDELAHALTDSGARVVVSGPERATALAGLRGDLADLDHLVVAADAPEDEGTIPYAQLLEQDGEPRPAPRQADDVAAIVYTSGTTGRPRGAMLTRGNLAANQEQSLAGRFEVGPHDVVLLVLPLAHIYAFNVGLGASFTAGAAVVLDERFDPARTLARIAEHRVTVLLGAPPMYVAWLEGGHLDGADLSSLRLAVSGAAPLPVPVIDRFSEHTGIVIEEGYGLTEAGPGVTSNAMGSTPRPGSVGLPLPRLTVRLVGDDGDDVPRGDPGEVWVRGPNVFVGYWNDEQATAEVLTPDGWLRTGDVGVQDEDGYLYLVDRRKDLVIVNGFNVYPAEVERVLHTHPHVAAAAVVGEPDARTGEAVVAHVVPRAGVDLDRQSVAAHCLDRLARYKCPVRIEVRDALPYTATGKLRRGEVAG